MIKDVHALLSRGGGVRGYPLTLFDLIGGITPHPLFFLEGITPLPLCACG